MTEYVDERALEIVTLRLAGHTLQEIGDQFRITRERVRQILEREGVDASVVRQSRDRAEFAAAREAAADVLRLWAEGGSIASIASALGLASPAVQEVVGERVSEIHRALRRRAINARVGAHAKRYPDEELLAAIRTVARQCGRTPSSDDYAALAGELGLPSAALITNRLGWRNAVRAAGLPPLPTRRNTYRRRWTEAVCLNAVLGVAHELGRVPSLAEYARRSAGRADLPSGATVRNRVGGWSDTRLKVARILELEGSYSPQHLPLNRLERSSENRVEPAGADEAPGSY
jgi:DNA-binding CsgD family transcriptional regulator